MTGFGDAPVMKVTPELFDYGQISIGCDNEERITIRNDGNLSLTVDNITDGNTTSRYNNGNGKFATFTMVTFAWARD